MIFLYLFKLTLYATAMGTVVALFIILFKMLSKERLGVRLQYCIWLLLLIRLLIPYAPQSSLSIYNLFSLDSSKTLQINEISNYINTKIVNYSKQSLSIASSQPKLKDELQISSANTINKNTNIVIPNENSVSKELYYKLACSIWLLGVIILALYTLIIALSFSIKLKKQKISTNKEIINLLKECKLNINIKTNIDILNTDLIKVPAIFGIMHPKLLLPIGIEKHICLEELQYIIYHELAHLKRKDIVVSCIVCILQILHWFNPILWYSFYRMRQDKELACDALALSYTKSEDYLKYAQTIIKLLSIYTTPNRVYGMACFINNKSHIKKRITMISLFKKNSYKWSVIPLVIFFLMGGVMLTNAKSNAVTDIKSDTVIKQSVVVYDIKTKTATGKLIAVKDPTKLVVGFSKQSFKPSQTTSQIASENNAICAINAGYSQNDINVKPVGIIIHDNKLVYNASKDENIIQDIAGFTNEGALVVGKYTAGQLKQMNVKEAVCSGAALIVNGKPMISQGNGGWGIGPRTAIGQKADGTILLLVLDGRSIKSMGADLLDVQNVLLQYGAVNASNLDGGSSSTMYYNGKVINNPCSAGAKERVVATTFMVLP